LGGSPSPGRAQARAEPGRDPAAGRELLAVTNPRPPARRKRRLLAAFGAAGALAVCGAGYVGFAHSPLVAVERVRIEGLFGPQAQAIAAALRRAARSQTTLAVDGAALAAAVRPFPEVRTVRAEGVFPNELRVRLAIQLPVAVAQTPSGAREAVGAGGALLGTALASPGLPTVRVPALSRAVLESEPQRAYLALLGGAPRPLLPFITSVADGERGLAATLKGGIEVWFGNLEDLAQKWRSLVAVLAKGDLAGAHYIDVREPQRPAVGGSGSLAPPAKSEQELLIASLQRALYGGPSAAPPASPESQVQTTTTQTETAAQQETATSATTESQGSSGGAGEGSSGPESEKTAATTELSASG
jgi:cell division septal protein FtsQ